MRHVHRMALDAGTNSPSLAVSQGEPSASALEMYACTSRTYAVHSMIQISIKGAATHPWFGNSGRKFPSSTAAQ